MTGGLWPALGAKCSVARFSSHVAAGLGLAWTATAASKLEAIVGYLGTKTEQKFGSLNASHQGAPHTFMQTRFDRALRWPCEFGPRGQEPQISVASTRWVSSDEQVW